MFSPTPEDLVPTVTMMLELLWKGQRDRHGTPDPATPLSVTLEQAEAAVHLALPLIQFFTAGFVAASGQVTRGAASELNSPLGGADATLGNPRQARPDVDAKA